MVPDESTLMEAERPTALLRGGNSREGATVGGGPLLGEATEVGGHCWGATEVGATVGGEEESLGEFRGLVFQLPQGFPCVRIPTCRIPVSPRQCLYWKCNTLQG